MTNSEAWLAWRQRAQCPGELKRKFSVVIVGSNRKAGSKTQVACCFSALTSLLEATERHAARLRSHAASVYWQLHWRASTAYAMWRFNFVYVLLHWHCIYLILLESLNVIELLLLCSVEKGNAKRWQTWRKYLFEMIQSLWLVLGTISHSLKSYLGSHGSSTDTFCLTHWYGLVLGHQQRRNTCRMREIVFHCFWYRKVILVQSQLENFHLNKEK